MGEDKEEENKIKMFIRGKRLDSLKKGNLEDYKILRPRFRRLITGIVTF